jgi:hypothetical protein
MRINRVVIGLVALLPALFFVDVLASECHDDCHFDTDLIFKPKGLQDKSFYGDLIYDKVCYLIETDRSCQMLDVLEEDCGCDEPRDALVSGTILDSMLCCREPVAITAEVAQEIAKKLLHDHEIQEIFDHAHSVGFSVRAVLKSAYNQAHIFDDANASRVIQCAYQKICKKAAKNTVDIKSILAVTGVVLCVPLVAFYFK